MSVSEGSHEQTGDVVDSRGHGGPGAPVQQRRTNESITPNESTRRYIYGSGIVGGGTHLVEIEAVNGNVTIRRQPRP